MNEQEAVLEPDLPLTGRCCCEQIRFEVSEPLVGILGCYCKRCQRRTGTAFSATGLTRPGTFRITAGENLVSTFDPGGGWIKKFCSVCGGHVFTCSPDNPELIAVRVGALDGDPGARIAGYQFTEYASAWAPPPDDDLPHFPERADWGQLLT